MRLDLHTHYYPPEYFERIERSGGDFSFGTSPTGQRIIRYRGARFFGVTAPMTDVAKRLEDMDRVGIDTEVLSLSTPNVYFVEGKAQGDVARMVNDAYAELEPSWSPDGKTIAFVTDRFSTDLPRLKTGNYRLAALDPATGAIRPLPSFTDGKNVNPQWAPNSKDLYFL